MRTTSCGKAISNIKQRELYILDFPFSDSEESKVRPAVIISNSRYNCSQDDVLAVPVTSRLKDVSYSIDLRNSDLDDGRVDKECRIRCDKVVSVDKKRLLSKIGKLNAETFEKVKTEIFAVLAE